MSWDAILFDLDGTLADTTELILHCYRHALQVHRGEVPPDNVWLETMGRPLHVQMRAFAKDEAEVEELVAIYVSHQRVVHDDFVSAFDGAREAVIACGVAGARLGIVTSKRRQMALRSLRCCSLDDLFPLLVTPEDTDRHKPDPAPVLFALSNLAGVRPERTLFVGDSPYDVEAGRAAGVRTAGVSWGPHGLERLEEVGPDYLFHDFDQLVSVANSVR